MQRSRCKVLAHRGARLEAPENTLLAFERGLAHGADGFELDVRLSADNQVIVLHDTNTHRVAPSNRSLRAENHTYRELRGLDLGQGERIPTLLEALELASAKGALINVELKHNLRGQRRLVELVTEILRTIKDAPDFVFLSTFDPRMVYWLARALPEFEVGWLVHNRQLWLRRAPGWPWLGARALHPEHTLLTPTLVNSVKQRRAKVNTWTVNDVNSALRAHGLGVDGIITDDPGLILKALREQHEIPSDPEGPRDAGT